MTEECKQVIHPNGDVTVKIPRERYERMYKVRNFILRNEYENGYSRHWMILRAMKEFDCSESFCRTAIKDFTKYHFGEGIRFRPIEYYIEEDKRKRASQRAAQQD